MTDKEMADAIKEKVRELNQLIEVAASENVLKIGIDQVGYYHISGNYFPSLIVYVSKVIK